jgi:hypothetical protein
MKNGEGFLPLFFCLVIFTVVLAGGVIAATIDALMGWLS